MSGDGRPSGAGPMHFERLGEATGMLTRRLCPVLVGRTSELSELDQLVAEVTAPPPAAGTRVALVTGEAGVGKSRLINEFVGRLDRSVTVLFGSANEGD